MLKPPDFPREQGISPSNTNAYALLEKQNENLLAMVKKLESEKELLLFSMSELDSTLDLATRTLDISEKLNVTYEYILKQHGFSFEDLEVTP